MPREEEIEEKLIEAIKAKKAAEEKLEKIRGKRSPKIEERVRKALPPFVDVEAYEIDDYIRIIVKPKPEYKHVHEVTEPLEVEGRRKELSKLIEFIRVKYFNTYIKPIYIFSFNELAARVAGAANAAKIVSYLCQKGSSPHCSILYRYINEIVRKIVSGRLSRAETIRKAGFPRLADLLEEAVEVGITPEEAEAIEDVVRYELKRILEKYARVYESPMDVPESEIRRMYKILEEAAKEPDYMWRPEPYDESDLIKAISRFVRIGVEKEVEEVKERVERAETKEELERLLKEVEELRKRLRERLKKLE